jgi:hypothetical protein
VTLPSCTKENQHFARYYSQANLEIFFLAPLKSEKPTLPGLIGLKLKLTAMGDRLLRTLLNIIRSPGIQVLTGFEAATSEANDATEIQPHQRFLPSVLFL